METTRASATSLKEEREEVRKELILVEHLLSRANAELRSRKRELQRLDEVMNALRGRGTAAATEERSEERTPEAAKSAQSRTGQRRVVLAPHPSPLAETPMRTGLTLPVPSQSCRSKWTSPTSSECGPGARPSFSAAELQSSRAEAWAEKIRLYIPLPE